ncbi:hypothetical protein CJ203_07680 [Corynebacterium tuscaniense]|uniref:TIGR02569 family protein n=1 Tax=Corynebacterium tuscaniense TaxID=302449 RepID=A0A2N6T468_9CORY|nr:hypothetical protein [Corynebacterium tuscaniense]KAA8739213.1 hypothetical protein F4V54_05585 [Corynebacterium tuscaniense]PMC64115.1 hypothetical protein CJ203_07680 [Corynebacterium tuscaniense]
MVKTIPGHVLTSFQAGDSSPVPLGPEWGNGVRFGRMVIAEAPAHATWSSKLREKVAVPGVRVVRPVRTTDGRFTVSGYRASDFVEGEPGHRVDEAIAAALRFDKAMAYFSAPSLDRDDVWARADRAVWAGYSDYIKGGQLSHADFFGCCIFEGSLPPALTDIVPAEGPRPQGYSAALTLIDGLLADAVDDAVVYRWSHIPDLLFLCERALEYRTSLAATFVADTNFSSNIDRVGSLLMSYRGATL